MLPTDPTLEADQFPIQRAQLLHGLVRLSTALSVVDGPVTREEYSAFRLLFPMPTKRDLRVRAWWQEASDNPPPPTLAASAILPMFPDREDMREEILARWVALASADGPLNRAERTWLAAACHALDLPEERLGHIIEEGYGGDSATRHDPYELLGVSARAPTAAIRHAWQQALRTFHPDALAAQGMGEEQQQRLGHRMAEINAAYDRILKMRGETR